VGKNNHFSVNKARYPSLGGMDSLSSLLIATVLRNETVGNIIVYDSVTIWRDGSSWNP